MASKDLVKGYCKESKCEYDVYTKEKADELLDEKANSSNVYTKTEANDLLGEKVNTSNIAVITGTIQMPEANSGSTIGSSDVDYPTGFNVNNSVVISIMGNRSDSGNSNWASPCQATDALTSLKGNTNLYAYLQESKISIYSYKMNDVQERHDTNFKLVLMKIS